jgi:hypothetical protein
MNVKENFKLYKIMNCYPCLNSFDICIIKSVRNFMNFIERKIHLKLCIS